MLLVSLVAATPAVADLKNIGKFGDWSAYADSASARSLCYMGSSPKKAEGKYTSRDPVFLLVSHRPAENVFGEVSVEAGYSYKDGSEVIVSIDDAKTFKLFSRGENAWNYDPKTDKAMIAAMKSGSQAVVKGTSKRGTTTTDTYSLSGFSAAFDAISKACGVR